MDEKIQMTRQKSKWRDHKLFSISSAAGRVKRMIGNNYHHHHLFFLKSPVFADAEKIARLAPLLRGELFAHQAVIRFDGKIVAAPPLISLCVNGYGFSLRTHA